MIYLAGPMTGIDLHNYPAFAEAARLLRAQGYDVCSPHEITPDVDHEVPQPWTYYLRRDLRALLDCDQIVLLPGWQQSRGVQLELTVATVLQFIVYEFVDGQLRVMNV